MKVGHHCGNHCWGICDERWQTKPGGYGCDPHFGKLCRGGAGCAVMWVFEPPVFSMEGRCARGGAVTKTWATTAGGVGCWLCQTPWAQWGLKPPLCSTYGRCRRWATLGWPCLGQPRTERRKQERRKEDEREEQPYYYSELASSCRSTQVF